MKPLLLVIPVLLAAIAIYGLLAAQPPARAVYLMLPAVSGVNESCVFADVTDLVQSGVLIGTVLNFSAHELVSLLCRAGDAEYSVMAYLDVSPFERRTIEDALPERALTVSNRSVYSISSGNYFVPIASEFYFYSFKNMDNPVAVMNDSLNMRNSYELTEMLSMLDLIPDSVGHIDSALRQVRAEFSSTMTVIKEWYVGTTQLSSTTAYIILRKPKDPDLVLGCADGNSTYDNETTSGGILYTCRSGNMCGPKYLVTGDSVAYTQVPMVCDSVEDAFTTEVLRNI